MTRLLTGQELSRFERSYVEKWQQVRAQLRALQLEAERLNPQQNKACYARLHHLMHGVDGAWDCMHSSRPQEGKRRFKSDDEAIEEGLVDVADISAELMEEYLQK